MRWLVAALAIALGCLGLDNAQAQSEAVLSVEPPRLTIDPASDDFEIRILVDDVTGEQGLGGYTLVAEYDPQVIAAKAVADSGLLAATDNLPICPSTGIDNDEGRLGHLCLIAPILGQPGPRVTEPQVLARITFEPVGQGVTALDISETTIVDANGDEIEATTANGQIAVGVALPTGTATFTAPDDEDRGDSDAGLIAAVGAGVAALALLAIGGGFLLWRRRGTRSRA